MVLLSQHLLLLISVGLRLTGRLLCGSRAPLLLTLVGVLLIVLRPLHALVLVCLLGESLTLVTHKLLWQIRVLGIVWGHKLIHLSELSLIRMLPHLGRHLLILSLVLCLGYQRWVLDRSLVLCCHSPLRLAISRVQMLVLLEPKLIQLRPAHLMRLLQEFRRPLKDIWLHFLVLFLFLWLVLVRRL